MQVNQYGKRQTYPKRISFYKKLDDFGCCTSGNCVEISPSCPPVCPDVTPRPAPRPVPRPSVRPPAPRPSVEQPRPAPRPAPRPSKGVSISDEVLFNMLDKDRSGGISLDEMSNGFSRDVSA